MSARLEKLLIEAEDCDLIGRLATDLHKRELFKRLAADLRTMARDVQAVISTHKPDDAESNQ
jgi:phosphate uptake regulator